MLPQDVVRTPWGTLASPCPVSVRSCTVVSLLETETPRDTTRLQGLLALEALLLGSGLDQRTVHGEVRIRQQAALPGLRQHLVEACVGFPLLEQALAILAERRGVPDGIIHISAYKPWKQPVIIELFPQQPLTAHGAEHLQQ
jgi:hypothetical protein